MKCYAVIDTNILVSALLNIYTRKKDSLSAASVIVDKIAAGETVTVYSEEILKEYSEVLYRAKFGFDEEDIRMIIDMITDSKINVTPSATGAVLPDMKDLPFYEVVMEKRSDNTYLVTGNIKHFPKEPFIVTARQMLEILEGGIFPRQINKTIKPRNCLAGLLISFQY